jgi:hypothetical protein
VISGLRIEEGRENIFNFNCSKVKETLFNHSKHDVQPSNSTNSVPATRKIGCAPITNVKRGKAIPVTGREGPYGCETSRLPHFLDNRRKDGGDFVSLRRQQPLTPPPPPRKIPGTHFCWRLSRPQGHNAAGRIR